MCAINNHKKGTMTMATKKAPKAQDSKAKKTAENPSEEKPKLSLVKAAIAILAETDESMGANELVEVAKAKGLWTPGEGKTPAQTLYSAISREIKKKGGRSRFVAVGKGKFKLTEAPSAE